MPKRGAPHKKLQQLLERYGDDLYWMVGWRCGTQPADTEEALALTWTWLLEHPVRLLTLDADHCFAYLYTTARHYAEGLQRQNRRAGLAETEQDEQALPDDTTDVEALVLRREEVRAVWQDIEALPAGLREVFLLRYAADCSNAEIAGQLDISPGLVATRLSRARKKLAAAIRRRREADEE